MIDLLKLNEEYDIVIGAKNKTDNKVKLDEQDKLHIRVIAILNIAKAGQIDLLLNRKFKEKFIYDEEDQMAYYCVKLIKERKVKKYADC